MGKNMDRRLKKIEFLRLTGNAWKVMGGKSMKKIILCADVKVHKGEYFDYILPEDIPEKYKKEFGDWMHGQTVGEVDGKLVVFAQDYERWFDMKTKGIPTYFD